MATGYPTNGASGATEPAPRGTESTWDQVMATRAGAGTAAMVEYSLLVDLHRVHVAYAQGHVEVASVDRRLADYLAALKDLRARAQAEEAALDAWIAEVDADIAAAADRALAARGERA